MSYGARPVGSALGAIVGGFYGAEACLYLAAIIFGAQALVILLSPAVSLARQPEMVGDGPEASGPADPHTTISASSCPALCRASTSRFRMGQTDVDGRDKPGHNDDGFPFLHPCHPHFRFLISLYMICIISSSGGNFPWPTRP